MEQKLEVDIKLKEEKALQKKEKHYENLSEVQKNTVILITTQHGQTDADVKNMKPSKSMMTILNQSIGPKVHAQLQYEFNKLGYMCDVGLAMCTSLKNGAIASQPDITDINGVSSCFVPDSAENEKISPELMMRLEEQ